MSHTPPLDQQRLMVQQAAEAFVMGRYPTIAAAARAANLLLDSQRKLVSNWATKYEKSGLADKWREEDSNARNAHAQSEARAMATTTHVRSEANP